MLWTCSFRPRQIRERSFTSIPMPALWKLGFDIQYNFEDLQRWYCSNALIDISGRTCSILWWNKLSSNLRAIAEEVAKKTKWWQWGVAGDLLLLCLSPIMGLLHKVNTSVEQLLRAQDLIFTLETNAKLISLRDDGYDGKGSHLAVLFQAKSFAEHKAWENRIIISGHRFPWCFHHEMPCKKCCLKYLRCWSRTKFLPGVRCSSKRVVSPKTFLEQPLYCRTKIPSHNIRDSLARWQGEVIKLCQGCLLHTADSAEDSKYVELLRNLVHPIVTSVTVLLAPLVHHLDKFCRKPLGVQRSSQKKFDEILTFFSPP